MTTLNITIVALWGIWQCSDIRLTRWPPRKGPDARQDVSIKHVSVHCPDGVALITYAGLGRVGQDSVADWVRKQIRGQSRTLDETLILIREKATVELSRSAVRQGIHHIFNIGAFLGGRPWGIVISNVKPAPPFDKGPPIAEFNTSAEVATNEKPMVLVTGGGRAAITKEDWVLLDEISRRKPERPSDYRQELANIVHRAALQGSSASKLISKACQTVYIPPEGIPSESELHRWYLAQQEKADRVVPLVFRGIDVTETEQVQYEHFDTLTAGDWSPKAAERSIEIFERQVNVLYVLRRTSVRRISVMRLSLSISTSRRTGATTYYFSRNHP